MQVVSADQFVDGLIAALSIEGKHRIDLDDPNVDLQFAKAYDEFLQQAEALAVVPDFVIAADPYYGDSTCLRDTLLAVRDLRSVALNNPRFITLTIKMGASGAERVLNESRIPRQVLQTLAKKYLVQIAD